MKLEQIFEAKYSAIEKTSGTVADYITHQANEIENVLKRRSSISFTADRAKVLIMKEVMNKLNLRPSDLAQDTKDLKPKSIDIRV